MPNIVNNITLITLLIQVLMITNTFERKFSPVVSKGKEKAPDAQIDNDYVYDKEPRIIGGNPANIIDYPYLVGVCLKRLHICGGSYIKSYWVLTAAHCLMRKNPHYTFTCVMGQTYLYEKGPHVQIRYARRVIPHPSYNPENDTNDIGLMNIESPFSLGPKVVIVKMAVTPYYNYETKCKVSGWGVTKEEYINDRSKLAHRLRAIRAPIVPQRRCLEIYYPKKYRAHFTDVKVFCAGYEEGGIDACQGDSGGPFVCEGLLVGITSWGIGCGRALPGVYVNVTTYVDWINTFVGIEKRVAFRSSRGEILLFRNLYAFLIVLSIICIS